MKISANFRPKHQSFFCESFSVNWVRRNVTAFCINMQGPERVSGQFLRRLSVDRERAFQVQYAHAVLWTLFVQLKLNCRFTNVVQCISNLQNLIVFQKTQLVKLTAKVVNWNCISEHKISALLPSKCELFAACVIKHDQNDMAQN